IQKRNERGVSRGRARHRAAQRAKGRRRGHGSREGALNARTPQKTRWIGLIRGMRRRLRELKKEGRIDVRTYRRFYAQSKGGMFKSRDHMEQQLRAAGALKEAPKSNRSRVLTTACPSVGGGMAGRAIEWARSSCGAANRGWAFG